MGTMEQMQNVMNGMAKIMGNAQNKVKMEQFQKSMKTYTTEKEKMEMVNEMVQDSMDFDEEVDDADAENLVRDMELDAKRRMEDKYNEDQ